MSMKVSMTGLFFFWEGCLPGAYGAKMEGYFIFLGNWGSFYGISWRFMSLITFEMIGVVSMGWRRGRGMGC